MSKTSVVNLVAEPEVISGERGDFITLTFAENIGYWSEGKHTDTGTLYMKATVNESRAALFNNILDSKLEKGVRLLIEYDLTGRGINAYESNSDKIDTGLDGVGANVTINLTDIAPSLRWATVEVTKNEKESRRRDNDDAPARGRTSSRSRRDDADDQDDQKDEAPSRGRGRGRGNDDQKDEAPSRGRGRESGRGRGRNSDY